MIYVFWFCPPLQTYETSCIQFILTPIDFVCILQSEQLAWLSCPTDLDQSEKVSQAFQVAPFVNYNA